MISHQSGNFTIEIRVCSKALILIVTCMICISFLITHKDEYVNLRRNYNLDFGSENDITTFKPVKIFIVAFPRYAFLFCLFLASISILFLRSSNVMTTNLICFWPKARFFKQLKTLYTPVLLEMICKLVAKKSADILNYRHSFTLSIL